MGDNTSRCCDPHHAVAADEHDAWAAFAGDTDAKPLLAAGEALYLRLHFDKQHPDRDTIQALLSPRCLANQEQVRQARYSLYLSTSGTVTNLHFDKSDGLLHQLTGHKSVALWAPGDTERLRMCGDRCGAICCRRSFWDGELPPIGAVGEADGVFTSAWPPPGVQTHHVIVEPGDTLFIPAGWPHYVTSLSATTASYVFALDL